MSKVTVAATYVSPTAAEMEALFADGEESPHFPRSDWTTEVKNGDTGLGYWDWLAHRYEAEQRDPAQDVTAAPAP